MQEEEGETLVWSMMEEPAFRNGMVHSHIHCKIM